MNMNMHVKPKLDDDGTVRKRILSGATMQWTVAIANMLLILGLFLMAVVKAPSSTRSNTTRCLQQVANEEHIALEAFFDNPSDQDALAQAMSVCAR